MQLRKHIFAWVALLGIASLGSLKAQTVYEIYNSSGGTWPSDYIILSGFSPNQSVVGNSVQYRDNTSTNWVSISLTGNADASGFYRIWLAANSAGAPWTPQLSDGSFAMTHTGSAGQCFQVALMSTTNTIAGTGTCPSGNIIDVVSVRGTNSGTANGSPACCGAGNSESPSSTTQSHRRASDTGDDETDFVLIDNPYMGPTCSAGTISGTTTICLGTTTQLSSNGDAGGTWSSNGTAATVNASGLVTSVLGGTSIITYMVTNGGCTSSTTAVVTVNTRPTANIAITENNVFYNTFTGLAYYNESYNDGKLCTGPLVPSPSTSATLTASGGGTYQWSNNGNNPITVSTAGIYTVTVTNAANCTATASQTISVNAAPDAGTISSTPPKSLNFNGAFPVCFNATITMNSTVPGGIWEAVNKSPSPQVVSIDPVTGFTMPLVSTINVDTHSVLYRVTSNGCRNSIRTTIEVLAPPNAGTISGTTSICSGQTTQLSSNGTTAANTIRTWGSSNTAVATVNASSGLVTGMSAGMTTINYTVTDFVGSTTSPIFLCTSTASVVVTVSAASNAGTISGTTTICPNATTQLSSNGDAGGMWSSSNTAAATVNPSSGLVSGMAIGTTTITYTVTANGCASSSTSVMVTVSDNTQPSITCPSNATVNANASCQGQIGSYNAASLNDNCNPVPVVTQSPPSTTTLTGHNAAQTVTLTANDGNGNTNTCTFTVTLKDQTAPMISNCPNNQFVLRNAACIALLPDHSGVPNTSDNCSGGVTVSQTPLPGTTLNGTVTVILTATDLAGNTASCSFTAAPIDQTPPSITCPANATVAANASCQGQIGTYTAATSSDNCNPMPVVTQSPPSTTTLTGHNAAQTVTLTATDDNGNTGSCTLVVTLKDVTPPDITCQGNVTVNANESCQGRLPFLSLTGGSDNCAMLISYSQSPPLGTFITGHNTVQTVTLRAVDNAGNTATCTVSVTLKDVTPPNMTCPGNTTVHVNVNCEGQLGSYNAATLNDNCNPNPTVTQSPAPLTVLTGHNTTQTITLTANDGNGNTSTCTFSVTLRDMTPPSITCPGNIVRSNDPGSCGAAVTYPLPVANDNCPGAGLDHLGGGLSGGTFNTGTTVVTWMATDAQNLTATCSFTVTVNDTQQPSITCPPNLARNTDPGACTALVTYANPTASDNCTLPAGQPTWVLGGTGHVTGSPNSSATFPKGTTTVQWKATDGVGQTKTCTFRVIVNDVQPPSMTCPPPINANAGAATCNAVVSYANPTFTDNCAPTSGTSVRTSGLPSGSAFPVGTSMVIFRATDAAGRTSTCSLLVIVTDTQLPSITCPGNVNVTGGGTPCQATAFYAPATASDNCDGPLTPFLVTGLGSGSNFPAGVTTNIWRAVATNGQSSDCSFTVTVSCPSAKPIGSTTLKNALEASPDASKVALSLVPNPAVSELTISVEGLGVQGGSLSMLDALGRIVWQYALGAEQPQTTLQGLASWPKGVYMVVLYADGKVVSRKVVLQ